MIAHDFKGLVLGARSITIACITDSTAAEAIAALYATNFCKKLGYFDVIMEGDALQIVKS
jgi:hypothetical protein